MADPQPISATTPTPTPRVLGRYEVIGVLARGGMGTVYLGRHSGEAGFQRLYAIKVMHPHLADEAAFVDMLLDEARIAARLHHPNVVPIVDLGKQDGTHFVVMEYVEGCTLGALLAAHRDARPPRLIIPLFLDALSGLHAAHVLTNDNGEPMNLVHRDVSPQNVLVGIDGSARITDFGVAKAESCIHTTRPGEMKGKLAYMSPEHFRNSDKLDRRADVFSAGAMLWSSLTGRKLFLANSDAETLTNVLTMEVKPPSTVGFQPPPELDAVCLRALERDPEKRFPSALEMEEALREAAIAAGVLGSKREVAAWVTSSFEQELGDRRRVIRSAVSQLAANPGGLLSSSGSSPASGLRMLPSVGAATPASSADLSPSVRNFAAEATPAPASNAAPTMSSATTATTSSKSTSRAVPAVIAFAVIAVAAVVAIVLARSHNSSPSALPAAGPPVVSSAAPSAALSTPSAIVTAAAPVPSASPRPPPAAAASALTTAVSSSTKRDPPIVRAWTPPPPPTPIIPRATTQAKPPTHTSKNNVPIVPDEF